MTSGQAAVEPFEIGWLRTLARRRIADSAERISEMQRRAEDRDDLAGVKLLLRTLSLMATQSQRVVDKHLRLAAESSDSERETNLNAVRKTVLQLERVFGAACEALISPPERDVASLVQPYVRLARGITGNEDTELIFESGESVGYAVWADVFEDIREGVEILAPGLKNTVKDLPPLALVTYPARGDRETLVHAVIAHEVTHLALAKSRASSDNPINKAFEAAIAGEPELSEADIKRLDDWLNEFLADALALRVIGPAFFFGLLEYLLPTHDPDPNYESPTFEDEEEDDELSHPPPSWRLERLKAPATRFFTEKKGRLGEARQAFERSLQLVPPPAPRPTGGMAERDYELLKGVLEEIDLDSVIAGASYPEARFRRDVPLVWDKLEQDIAPVERVKGRKKRWNHRSEDTSAEQTEHQTEWSQTIDWRSILNGGYVNFLHGAMVASAPEDDAASRRRDRDYVNSLIRGAIELSELHRRMIELSDQFDVLNDLDPVA